MKISPIIKQLINRNQDEEQWSIYGKRPSSFPFISGDTFSAISDLSITTSTDHEQLFKRRSIDSQALIFLEADFARNENTLDDLLNWLTNNSASPTLIIHNGDFPPTHKQLKMMSEVADSTYCVNLVDEFGTVSAIPIGLENLHYRNNGRLQDFYESRSSRQTLNTTRKKEIFGAFNIGTNKTVRGPLASELELRPNSTFFPTISRKQFRTELAQSMFVASPPGNGLDCHRTWEAIYLGSVPIVLRGTLAASLIDDLPIVAVDQWDEVLDLNQNELEALYFDTISKPEKKAFMPYWVSKIHR